MIRFSIAAILVGCVFFATVVVLLLKHVCA
jgi:hypothetical protein